jgi:ABC-type branched-subunit amino acid transport system substrate-binding protein
MNENEFEDFFQSLTLQEKEVLKLFLQGYSDPEIAVELSITEGTIRAHFAHIKKSAQKKAEIVGGYFDRNVLISCFIKFKGAWVANCVRERWGYPKWEDPDSNRTIERSGSNFYLEKIKNCTDNEQTIKLYENAIKADHSDPYAQIYFNNAKARLQGNTLKIGVVIAKAGNDFHEFASTQVLRGIADAQTQFNESGGKDRRLLEIEIRNDGNRPSDAQKIAENFVNDPRILVIIGHHSSESTQAALHTYEVQSLAVVSPTSTSSKLKRRIFFRTVGSTELVAKKYADYIKQYLKLDKIVVAYHKSNEFSETLKDDFEKAFNAQGGEIINIDSTVDINDDSLNIEDLISDATRVSKALLVISSIETNSVAIAIATENSKLQSKLQLLFTTSLPEIPLLEKGGAAVEGAVLVSPCSVEKSDYIQKAQKRWGQQKINWRVATSYDATQAVIEAIRLSEIPTREQVLQNLQTIKLSPYQTSGLGVEWSRDRTNVHSKYCIFQIRQQSFEEIIEK